MNSILTLNDFAKSAFSRLLKPFENSTEDVIKITKALGIAIRTNMKKQGQIYKKNENSFRKPILEPSINHSLRMALILSEELHIRNMDVVCAAILHNVLNGKLSRSHDEDAELREEIELIFGHHVLEIVDSLAMPALNYEEKDKVLSNYFENIAKSSKDVRYIKLVDRLDNVRSLKNGTHKDKVLRYKEETQKYVLPIAEKTDEKLVFKLSVALYELK